MLWHITVSSSSLWEMCVCWDIVLRGQEVSVVFGFCCVAPGASSSHQHCWARTSALCRAKGSWFQFFSLRTLHWSIAQYWLWSERCSGSTRASCRSWNAALRTFHLAVTKGYLVALLLYWNEANGAGEFWLSLWTLCSVPLKYLKAFGVLGSIHKAVCS